MLNGFLFLGDGVVFNLFDYYYIMTRLIIKILNNRENKKKMERVSPILQDGEME
jgi:hypothetical protein